MLETFDTPSIARGRRNLERSDPVPRMFNASPPLGQRAANGGDQATWACRARTVVAGGTANRDGGLHRPCR